MNEVEIRTVDTILDKGVRVPIPAPLFLRVFGKKTVNVTVHRPVMGNMLRISRLYLKLNIDSIDKGLGEWARLMETCTKPVTRIVAYGLLRGRTTAWLLNRPLAWYLRGCMHHADMANLAAMLVMLSGVQDFSNTIKFLALMKMTGPKNLSQDEAGS